MSKISVVTANKNGALFLRETIESISSQTYQDVEHIIVDGQSSDASLSIISEYPHIRLLSEPDDGPNDAFAKGFLMAKGEYIMVMCVSDIYLCKTWFERCVDLLEKDSSISLVWGLGMNMNQAGDIDDVWQPWLQSYPPPQGQDFLPYWMGVKAHLPELNYCVRRNVFLDCFMSCDSNKDDSLLKADAFLNFLYQFNTKGYLPFFLPIYAHCGRQHSGQHGEVERERFDEARSLYAKKINNYLKVIIFGQSQHAYRDGNSKVISYVRRNEAFKIVGLFFFYKLRNYFIKPRVFRRLIERLVR